VAAPGIRRKVAILRRITEVEIACSLNATELTQRLEEMSDLGRGALVDVRRGPGQVDLRFAGAAAVRDRVDAIAAAESECCPFLNLTVTGDQDAVVLSIEAPEEADVVLSDLVAAFSGRGRAS
jgi:hypothetical protein